MADETKNDVSATSAEKIEEYKAKYPHSYELLASFANSPADIEKAFTELEAMDIDEVYYDALSWMAGSVLADVLTEQLEKALDSALDEEPLTPPSKKRYDA